MILFAVFVGLTLLLSARADCPADPPCTCSSKYITCSSKSLTQVPIIHSTTDSYSHIMLSRNNITRIEDNAFSNLKIDGKLNIYLSFNNIEYIGDNAFSGLENATTHLSLDHNKLEHLPRALLLLNNLYSLQISYFKPLDSEIMKHVGQTLKFLHLDVMNVTTGWFPELKYLTALRSLVIYTGRFATFSGRLPDSLAELSIFRSVIMGNLTLLCNGNSLRAVRFYENDLSKASMPVCQNPLPGVNSVTFEVNTGWEKFSIKALVMNYPKVLRVNLEENNISELDIGLASRNNEVQSLTLSANRLTQIPKGLQEIRALRYLYLKANNITALNNGDFANMTNMFMIRLGHNPISFIANASFKSCTHLSDLGLDFARLTSVPETLKYLTKLHTLELSNNNIDALNDGDFRNLISLQYLRISFNPITFVHKNTFDGCPHLKSLYLSSAYLKSVPAAIMSLSQLQAIDLSGNSISAITDDDLKYKAVLTSMSLNNNPLSSISRNAFKGAPNLRVLYLRDTLLTTVPRAFSDIPVNTKILLNNAPIRCDCDLAWVPKEDVDISGNCVNSTTTIVDFIENNIIKSCPGGSVIG